MATMCDTCGRRVDIPRQELALINTYCNGTTTCGAFVAFADLCQACRAELVQALGRMAQNRAWPSIDPKPTK